MTRDKSTRRIILAVVGTVAILVLLFSYRTSLDRGVAAEPAGQAHIVSGATGAATQTGQGPDPAPGLAPAAGQTPPPKTSPTQAPPTQAPPSKAPPTQAPPTQAPPSKAPPTQAPPTQAAAAPIVVDGATEMTPYGPVQVKVTLTSGRITDATAIQYPTGQSQDQEINSYALPQLRSEVLSAQSAKVDAVSGATYTTQGYLASLQSALDAAHFGS